MGWASEEAPLLLLQSQWLRLLGWLGNTWRILMGVNWPLLSIQDVCLVSWVGMHFTIFFQGEPLRSCLSWETWDKGAESLLLLALWSRISTINFILHMLPTCLAFSPLYLGFHLSLVGDIFAAVSWKVYFSFSAVPWHVCRSMAYGLCFCRAAFGGYISLWVHVFYPWTWSTICQCPLNWIYSGTQSYIP